MPQLINYGKEMLRVSPKGIEYSTNGGRSWMMRYSGSSCGTFLDLLPYGNELLLPAKDACGCLVIQVHLVANSTALPMVVASFWQPPVKGCIIPQAPVEVG